MMQGRSSAFALISHSHTIAADSRSTKGPNQSTGYSHPQDHVVPRACSVPASTTNTASSGGKAQQHRHRQCAAGEEGRGAHALGLGGAEGPNKGLSHRRGHSNTEW